MSSMPITLEKLKQLIECSICLEKFRAPKVLKCLHTFCEDCLNTTVKVSYQGREAGFRCPECRSFTTSPTVTNNFHMVKLIDLFDEATNPKNCVFCERREATWKCADCVDFYCDTCKEGHLKVRALSSHKFIKLEEGKHNLVIDQPMYCTKHPSETLKYSCKECQTLLCVTCALVDHEKDHVYESIGDALKACMPCVLERIAQAKVYWNNHKAREDKLQERCVQIQAEFNISQRLALERKKEVIAKAEADFNSVISNLTEIKDAEEEKLQAAKIFENAKYRETLSSVDYVESTVLTSSGVHLLREIQENISPQMRNLIATEKLTPELSVVNHPLYQPVKDEHAKINCIGEAISMACNIPSLYRFKDVDFAKYFSEGDLEQVNTVKIDLQKEPKGYRISVSCGKVLICYWDIASIVIYTMEGSHFKTLNANELHQPSSACFLNDNSLASASDSGLHMINIQDEQIKKLSDGKYSDVQNFNNTLYALRYDDASIVIATKAHDWASATVRTVDIGLGTVDEPSSTLVVISERIYVCNHNSTVYEFNMKGRKIRAFNIEMKYPFLCAANCDGDVIVVSDTKNEEKPQCIISGDKTIPFKIPGVEWTQDIAFQDENDVWVLASILVGKRKYKLHHFKRQ